MPVTVQMSRLRTASPAEVVRRRSLRRVATRSPMWACSPPAISMARSPSTWPAAGRACCTGGLVGGEGLLHGAVDGVDVVVGRRHQCQRATMLMVVDPHRGHAGEVLLEGAGEDPT